MLVSPLKLSLAPTVLLALGGCTTYTVSRPAFAYYAVPCSTPGAFVAAPIDTRDPTYGLQAAPPPSSPPATTPQANSAPRTFQELSANRTAMRALAPLLAASFAP